MMKSLSDQLLYGGALHHEDFTGGTIRKVLWAYETACSIWTKKGAEELAAKLGMKVSHETVALKKIRDFVLVAVLCLPCVTTDSFDITLATDGVDICESMFDGDPSRTNYQSR
jgi:hypothetical protein